jgi:hypothetical protein
MPPIQPQKDEVPVMQAGTNTRIEILKKYVELFGIQKGSKKTGEGDFFVEEYLPTKADVQNFIVRLPEEGLFICYLRPRQNPEGSGDGAV